MSIAYEWFVEEMDGEDVDDVWTFDTYQEAKVNCSDTDKIGLRKLKSRIVMGEDDLDYITYAYIEHEMLPNTFDDDSKVPKKYQKEFK